MMMHQTPVNQMQDIFSSLSPIGKILLCCTDLQPSPQVIAQAQLQLPKIQDWNHLFERAQYHKILPQLHQLIQQVEPSLVEPALLKKLARYHCHWQKRSLLCTYEMAHVAGLLAEQGIPTVVFKGPTLAQIAYGKYERRSFTDLDFWVSKSDYFRVKEVLSERGYKCWKPLEKSAIAQQNFQLYAGEYTLFREQGKIFLDIHHRCIGAMNIAFSADFSILWQRLETIMVAGKTIQTFSRPDTLIYLCINGAKDGWPCLRHVLDIAALIQSSPELDWILVRQYAAELNVERVVTLGLMLTETVLGVAPPSSFGLHVDRFRLRNLVNHLAHGLSRALSQGQVLSFTDEFWMRWRICADGDERLQYCLSLPKRLFKLIFSVNSIDKQFLPLPRQLAFLYYVLRPIRALQVYRKSIFKILVK